MIEGLDSDHYRAQAIEMLIGSGRPSADDMALLIRMLPRMKSDHYKTQTLMKMLDRATLTPEQQEKAKQLKSQRQTRFKQRRQNMQQRRQQRLQG